MSRGRITREIFEKKSTLSRLINCVGSLGQERSDSCGLNDIVRGLIVNDCAYYERSEGSQLLCSAGELDGKQKVHGSCALCIVSQFNTAGRYVGPGKNATK